MDRADRRRGKETVHKVWNDNTAILSGDAMLVLAYQFMAECPSTFLKEVMDLFSLTALEICEGPETPFFNGNRHTSHRCQSTAERRLGREQAVSILDIKMSTPCARGVGKNNLRLW